MTKLHSVLQRALGLCAAFLAVTGTSARADDFVTGLTAIQQEWVATNYQTTGKNARHAAFAALIAHTAKFSEQYPTRAEALGWEGIVLSAYADEVNVVGAIKYARAARNALEGAERLDANALAGGIYASLGALYSKAPRGFHGFGDEKVAEQYFRKALAVDPDSIDNNYLYGEFLLDRGDYAAARSTLEHALAAPVDALRPALDAGRRSEILELLAVAQRKASL